MHSWQYAWAGKDRECLERAGEAGGEFAGRGNIWKLSERLGGVRGLGGEVRRGG